MKQLVGPQIGVITQDHGQFVTHHMAEEAAKGNLLVKHEGYVAIHAKPVDQTPKKEKN